MIFDITRLTKLAGQDFTNPTLWVSSPHITARESIEIGDYIVTQQERIAELERSIRQQQMHIDYALNTSIEQLVERITELEDECAVLSDALDFERGYDSGK